MKLTPENKVHIDSLTYRQLLAKWRFAPIGEPWFEGATGTYWCERMHVLRTADPIVAVETSKEIGWR